MKLTLHRPPAVALAAAIAVIGLISGGAAIYWLTGSLGISAGAATQIATAVDVGGWALVLVGAAFGFGIGGGIVATTRWFLARVGKRAAIR